MVVGTALFGAIAVADGLARLGAEVSRPWWHVPVLLAGTAAATAGLVAMPYPAWVSLGGVLIVGTGVLAAADLAVQRRTWAVWTFVILLGPAVYLLTWDVRPNPPVRFDQPGLSPIALLLVTLVGAGLVLTVHAPLAPAHRQGPLWTVEAADRHLTGAAVFALAVAGGFATFSLLAGAVTAGRVGGWPMVGLAAPACLLILAAIATWRTAPGWSRGLTGAATVAAGAAIALIGPTGASREDSFGPADPETAMPLLVALILLTATATVAHPGARGGTRPARSILLTGAGLTFTFALVLAGSLGWPPSDAAVGWAYASAGMTWTVVPLVVMLVEALPAVVTPGARLGDAVLAGGIAIAGAALLASPAGEGWVFSALTAVLIGALLVLRLTAGRRPGEPPAPAQVAASTG